MPRLKPEQLAGDLKKHLAAIYYLSGDETLLVQECSDAVRSAAKHAGFIERELYHAEAKFDWSQLHYSSQSLSLFGDKKIIEIRLPAKLDDKARKALVEYAEAPGADTLLLLIGPKVERSVQNAKWFKTLESACVFVQIWPITGPQLPRWIQQRARELNLRIEPAAVELLVSRIEGNLLAAAQELEKLKLLSDDGNIDVNLMAHAVANSARYDVYGLIDVALHGDARHAVRILHGLRGEGTEVTIVLWALAREIRTLLQLKEELEKGKNLASISRQFGIWDNRQALVKNALSRFKTPQLHSLLRKAGQIDRAIKGMHDAEPWQACLELVLNIAGVNALDGASERLALRF